MASRYNPAMSSRIHFTAGLTRALAPAVLLAAGATGCSAPAVGPPAAGDSDVRAIEEMLETLYAAFCFDAGGEADWEGMRALFVDGAAFVAPLGPGEPARAVGADQFVADFRAFIADSEEGRTGFHERVVGLRIDRFGTVAHAFVAFEGFVPGEGVARTRGLDSIQLVRDAGQWKLVSFTTQYESEDRPRPGRFLGRPGA